MRFLKPITAWLALGALLAPQAAQAAGNKGGPGPGGGGAGPGAGSGAGSGSGSGSSFVLTLDDPNADQGPQDEAGSKPAKAEPRPFEMSGIFETHRLIRQSDLNGAAPNREFNFLYLGLRYDLTDRDRVTLRGGAYQRFLVDDGESGFRADDLSFAYTRFVPLPQKVTLRLIGSALVPISYGSQKSSLITAPRFTVAADRRFGYLTLSARALGELYLSRYTTAEGGSANTKWRTAGGLEAELAMPFHEALSVGASLYLQYSRPYNVQNSGTDQASRLGAEADIQYARQPVQEAYGGEAFVRYTLPELSGARSDLTVSFAQGDPTLGYTSVIHDGVGHGYLFYRRTSEVYAALAVRY